MKTLEFGGRKIHAFLPEGGARLKVWTHMQADEAAALFEAAGGGIALFAADGYDWNADLSPWPANACFKGGEDFAGRAPAQLEWLAGAIETAEQELADAIRAAYAQDFAGFSGQDDLPRAILGYSLAGLFAVWAMAECDLFDMCASVSGSLWYDGFLEHLQGRAERFAGKRAYLSLGDREAKTRNMRLACVQERTEAARDLLAAAGAQCVFELNPGNHFQDPAGRCARAAEWLKGR